ncbi:MAG: hypothetical protein WBQ77_05755 [Methyloceanibacter sp.]|jgi:uncharacterized membrane protein|uniref:hypothetical protein n=1 Tax=Methyloceanibacter sp. TaxID=1965321 RepID=UPI003C6AB14E
MEASEYLAFLPLLIYGIALADLLSQWRRFFDRDYFYLPYFLATLLFTENAIWSVYGYLEVTSHLDGIGYFQYWAYLLQPMLFLVIVSALTPDPENKDTEAYFIKRMPVVFGMMAVYIGSHFIADYGEMSSLNVARVLAILLCIVMAVSKRAWLVYVATALWLFSLYARM